MYHYLLTRIEEKLQIFGNNKNPLCFLPYSFQQTSQSLCRRLFFQSDLWLLGFGCWVRIGLNWDDWCCARGNPGRQFGLPLGGVTMAPLCHLLEIRPLGKKRKKESGEAAGPASCLLMFESKTPKLQTPSETLTDRRESPFTLVGIFQALSKVFTNARGRVC